jgi:hypothetical protein
VSGKLGGWADKLKCEMCTGDIDGIDIDIDIDIAIDIGVVGGGGPDPDAWVDDYPEPHVWEPPIPDLPPVRPTYQSGGVGVEAEVTF